MLPSLLPIPPRQQGVIHILRLSAILILAASPVLGACNLRDAMTTDIESVARAGEQVLTVDELAEAVAQSNALLNRVVVERWAQLWIDYSLFAQRLAAGDSLLDTLAVTTGMWYDLDSALVSRFRGHLVDSLVHVDDAFIDSAFAAGDHRLIDIIQVQTRPEMTSQAREQRRRATHALRARLAAGTSWERVSTDLDPEAGARGGRMLASRGALPPLLADTVFALAPGQLSSVIETEGGFYVVRRPNLADARGDFAQALADSLVERMEAAYSEALPQRWNVVLRSRAPALMREAARYPYQSTGSRKVLGTFEGGEFTVADFVRWLPVLRLQGQIATAGDEELRELARSLIQNELLFLEAQRRGITLEASDFTALKQRLATQIDGVVDALDLDVVLGTETAPEVQRRLVQLAVARHLEEVIAGRRRLAVVPPFLTEMLRGTFSWDVSYAAVDRTVERARIMRLEQARTGGPIRPPLPVRGSPAPEDRSNGR